MGMVDEPYLQYTPDLFSFCATFTDLGYSFGEAAYASLTALSWQTTIIRSDGHGGRALPAIHPRPLQFLRDVHRPGLFLRRSGLRQPDRALVANHDHQIGWAWWTSLTCNTPPTSSVSARRSPTWAIPSAKRPTPA